MKVGFIGERKLYEKNRCALKEHNIDCIKLLPWDGIDYLDGMIISALKGGGICFSLGQYKAIKERQKKDLAVWGMGYGAYCLSRDVLSILDCNAHFYKHEKRETTVIGVPSWQERFVVSFAGRIVFFDIAPHIAILSRREKDGIILRQGNILASTFNGELCKNKSIYAYFAQMLYSLKEV